MGLEVGARHGRGDVMVGVGSVIGTVAVADGVLCALFRTSFRRAPAGPRRPVLAERTWHGVRRGHVALLGSVQDVVACGIFPFPFEFGVRSGDGSVVLVVVAHRCISRTCRCVRRTQSGHGRCIRLLPAPSGSSQWSGSSEGLWHSHSAALSTEVASSVSLSVSLPVSISSLLLSESWPVLSRSVAITHRSPVLELVSTCRLLCCRSSAV